MSRAIVVIKRVLSWSPLFSALRVALGIVFIAASLDKIQDPEAFADSIANYRIVPFPFIHIMALILPWLEIIAGSMLVLGIWIRANAALTAGMLLVFVFAISQALMRNLDISCGCFDSSPSAHKMTRWTLYWDLIWIGWATLVFFYDRGAHSLSSLLTSKLVRRSNNENP
jgi:uncharacterized membrane protein YphA (DoxX/SURF4 family)